MSDPSARRGDVDLVVYGGTAGGVVAATCAARLGMRVALVEPTGHVGGMVTGGLTRSDIERQEHVIGGLARALFEELRQRYGVPADSPLAWRFEPKLAELVLREWLDEAGVVLLTQWRLGSVELEHGRIHAIVSEERARLAAPCFVDASYEGDLLAGAGVSYAVGREDRGRHGESLAGRLEMLPSPHQFTVQVSARNHDGDLLPYVQLYDTLGPLGQGDGKLQSYCYRVCLTEDAATAVPFPQPDGYDPDDYLLLRRYVDGLGDRAVPRHFIGLGRLPNGKFDVNSDGPVSTNLLSASWGYVEAGTERRAEVADEHLRWAQGLLFFLSSDPGVPQRLRRAMGRLGLPADEFVASQHWPPQLYVREARRMVGEYVLTQHDLLRGDTGGSEEAVGWGGYNIDIREVQWVAAPVSRFPERTEEVLTEGYLSVPVPAYPISYRVLLPRRAECTNLLVSTCVSASHVAFASFRMEPQFMMAGQAAGAAAALAAETGRDVHELDVKRLRALLRRQGQIVDPPIG